MKRALLVSTVSQSLVFQAPAGLEVLKELGYQLVFAAGEDRWSSKLVEHGDFKRLDADRNLGPRQLLRARHQMRKLLREEWDLVQLQSPIASALARSIARIPEAPSIYVAHGFHFHKDGAAGSNFVFEQVERALAGRTRALAVVADEDFRAAMRIGLHRRTLLWRLPGAGVDLSKFSESPAGGRGRQLFALFCGELNANKDPLTAVTTVEEVRRRGHDLHLTIVGDGAGAEAERVREIGAQKEWITLIPSISPVELAGVMRSAIALIAPSHREGLPRVIIEAIASGTPVVARSNRGSRELLAPLQGSNRAWLLSGDDTDRWASALIASIQAGPLSPRQRSHVAPYSETAFRQSYAALIEATQSGTRGAFDTHQQGWSASSGKDSSRER